MPEYKYRIQELLDRLPKKEYSEAIVLLPISLGINASTFRKYKAIKKGDSQTIPADHLRFLASFFKVSIEAMFSTSQKEVSLQSMRKLKELPIAKKYGMNAI